MQSEALAFEIEIVTLPRPGLHHQLNLRYVFRCASISRNYAGKPVSGPQFRQGHNTSASSRFRACFWHQSCLWKHPQEVFWIYFTLFKYLFSIFVFSWVIGELRELSAKFWNSMIKIHGEIIFQSWPLLTLFYSGPIVHWLDRYAVITITTVTVIVAVWKGLWSHRAHSPMYSKLVQLLSQFASLYVHHITKWLCRYHHLYCDSNRPMVPPGPLSHVFKIGAASR